MNPLKLFKKKAPAVVQAVPITRTESLACIPEKSPAVTWAEHEGKVTIEYPLPLKPFFISIARKFNKEQEQTLTKKLELDDVGSTVWRMIDGRADVKTLIKAIAPEAGLTLQEAEISITTFLRELGRRGLILLK